METIMDFINNKLEILITKQVKKTLENEKGERIYNRPEENTNTQKPGTHGRQDPQQRETENVKRTTDSTTTNTERAIEETENEENESWATVAKRRRNAPIILGTKQSNDEELQPEGKTAWLYIGKVRNGTTGKNVKDYLMKNGIKEIKECEMLKTEGHMKAFKIGIPFEALQITENPDLWPEGIIVRRFSFRRQRNNKGVPL
ncbi:hypothetical protein ANN_21329 [Periplaneta americana]|uniref:Uncharacterized protein n=1 Tax=Periplaneta americana TaxID=6978 RepID=A0ABQ8SF45_PERAM|nr:hypothetical protein ANN_21329 [Periplaneta americana]